MASAGNEQVSAFRSFNRFYTQKIGVLEKRLLDSPFSLTQARVLYELAQRKSCTATQISEALELDPGYLSRIMTGFVKQGLLTRTRSREDTRQIVLALTAVGRRSFRKLDRDSRDQAATLLSSLPSASREDLFVGMRWVERALSSRGSLGKAQPVIRQHRPGDLGWAIELHGRVYAEEYAWNKEFEALVATLFARFATRQDPATERFWVAELNGRRTGCVFVVRNDEDPGVAQLRCLLVDPGARGHGVGNHLVQECIAFARSAGYRAMMLWTNDVLVSARRIYEAAGFVLTKEYKHHSFGHDLVGQIWLLEF